LTGLRIGG
jgi:hypothetical protein